MPYRRKHLELTDDQLLAECDVHVYKSSGPGGQHRNKVSSAVRLRHRPTAVSAHGDDSRSQHENKRTAIRRLRMNLACQVRCPVDLTEVHVPPAVTECVFRPRGRGPDAPPRLEVGRKDHRFWTVIAFCLDVLDVSEGRLSDAAAALAITTANLVSLFQSDRHALAAAQTIRKRHGQKPLR